MTRVLRPIELRSEAREVMVEEEAARAAGHDMARRDQWGAAQSEHTKKLHAVGRAAGLNPVTNGASVDTVAWNLALQRAAERRVKHRCPHVARHEVADPAVRRYVFLSQKRVACEACVRSLPVIVTEDGVCDVCDVPCRIFYPLLTAVGPYLIGGDVCKSCKHFAEGAAE